MSIAAKPVVVPYSPATTATGATSRLQSLDVIRGIVMILMALDHVRVYSGVPAGGPTAGVFFTRWVTHFAAPVFVLFAGTSAFLLGRRLGDTRALARYLFVRGGLLVLLELTVLRLAWTFNLDYAHYMLAGVIWMLGWCMILMAGLVRLSPRTVGVIGLVVIVGQRLAGLPAAIGSESWRRATGWLWQFLYLGGDVALGGLSITVLYVIVPWIGVMAVGYAFGTVMMRDPATRRRICLRVGLAAIAAFLVLAGIGATTSSQHAEAPFVFRLLNQRKYPASATFLLMTLGPAIPFVPTAERLRGRVAGWLTVFGRVPLFFYLLHIPLIHALAVVVSLVREGTVSPWLFANHPMRPPPPPPGYTWSLALLYLVFAVAVVVLYFPCRWYAEQKALRRAGWMRYL
jgi:uncharacterized membrane protein